MTDESRRRELGVALDEDERDVPGAGDLPQQGGLARAGRPLEDDVRTAAQRRLEELGLQLPVDDPHQCSCTTT
ncbi:MAG TPA: hypothetical protein VL916_16415, partial [Ilumatobacteraceae bacterium]|nr:hypothetical protein [Ilumatobacteraceae bacterium]